MEWTISYPGVGPPEITFPVQSYTSEGYHNPKLGWQLAKAGLLRQGRELPRGVVLVAPEREIVQGTFRAWHNARLALEDVPRMIEQVERQLTRLMDEAYRHQKLAAALAAAGRMKGGER